MPVKRVKDLSQCVCRFILRSNEKPYYWHVYLWKDVDALYDNVGSDVSGKVDGGNYCMACHCAVPVLVDPETKQLVPSPKLGELHFVLGEWDMEIIAHELLHALFYRMNTLGDCVDRVSLDMHKQEPVCYEFGRWVDEVYRKLWAVNPNRKWRKDGENTVS